jgi:hypothetical protein
VSDFERSPSQGVMLFWLRFSAAAQAQDANIGQIPVSFVVIQAVADNELVGDAKSRVVCLHVCDAPLDFVQQNSHTQVLRLLFFKNLQQKLHCESGIQNVFDHQH